MKGLGENKNYNKIDCFRGKCSEEAFAMTPPPSAPPSLRTSEPKSHFRFYASSMGRFLKPDNIIPDITNPQNWNASSYVKGNPVNFNDPSGHMPIGGWGPVGSESNKTFPDNGEPPSLGGWADNIGQTVSNIKYELIKAGFSKEAVDRAEKEGNLKPVVKVYVVHGEDKDKKGGHVAISATLGGESIWWSHGGSVPLYGRKGPEAEQQFLEHYRNDKDVTKIEVFNLNLNIEQSIGVAREITKRVFYNVKGEGTYKIGYEFRELSYNCIESVSDILHDSGVSVLMGKRQLMPMWTASFLFDIASKEKEVYYPQH